MDTAQARPVKRRHPALAALLSLLAPGLGQIYNTKLTRGLAIIAIYGGLLVLLLVVQLALPIDPALAVAPWTVMALLLPLFIVATAVDAFLGARRIGTVSLTKYNERWIYIAGIVIWAAVTAFPLDIGDGYSIPSGNNLPTLVPGDRVVAWKRYYRTHEPSYGDIAVFKRPPEDRVDFIMRIVGLPGDRIQVVEGVLHINGEPVSRERVVNFVRRDSRGDIVHTTQYRETLPNGRSYMIIERFGDTGPLDNTVEWVVPREHFFAAGDNRDNSADSRGNGRNLNWFVPTENLRGYPIYIY